MAEAFVPGYHTRPIEKGVLGEPSKIMEEAYEFEDACAQGVQVMALVELSDLMGAIQAFLAKHHPGTSIDDLLAMSHVTERAFRNGRRS
jgi:phosphoribosyl-ATP pyrophosphohydrolase